MVLKYLSAFTLLVAVFSHISCNISIELEPSVDPGLVLWYDKPAGDWTEALPVGNGRLAAMVYGRTENETIQFNEETLWSGQPHDYAHEGAYKYLDEIRQMLWKGKQEEATKVANEHFMSQPFGQQCYQPFGNIVLDFPGHENAQNFKRFLDLRDALSSVYYEVNGVKFKREIFASEPDQAIVMHLDASLKNALNFTVGLNSPHSDYRVFIEGNEIVLQGKADNYSLAAGMDGYPYPESKITFEARLKVVTEGGEVSTTNNQLVVTNAKAATLKLVAATNFVDYQDISANPGERCANDLKKLDGKSYEDIKEDHVQDYHQLFNRVTFDLGASEISKRPTNERLISFKQDQDPALVALLYQYGRYLLISSSRTGTQSANLQGIWNDRMSPPWDSKYTININTEMNYWPAENTNLAECAEPLIKMVEELAETGKKVAKEHYDLEGWVAHHNTDLWRGAAPINNANHGLWATGGAWLTQHLWWHFQYSGDTAFLKNTAYPVLKQAAQFFTGYLVPDPKNPEWLVSGPSNSPELGGLVMAPTMDHQIIRELFANTVETAEILGMDSDFTTELKEMRGKIAPNQIGQYGQLQEWLVDNDDPKNQHRHVSHLWGLFPGNEIHPLTTLELAEACKVTLSQRGDGGTGWSRAWKINFWARLLDGDHSFLLLKNLMVPSITQDTDMKDKGGLYMNLFDAHPPFQIDGNFGGTSGITEMLLQSHLRDEKGDYFQDILPALPRALPNGKISGIKGRGGFEFTIEWKNGALLAVKVRSLLGNRLNLRHSGNVISKETTKGEIYSFSVENF